MTIGDKTFWVVVEGGEEGQRLDKLLSARLPDLSRTRIQALVDELQVTDEHGKPVKNAALKVRINDRYGVIVPPPVTSDIKPVEMELDIIHEDDDLLIINKPAGMTVHPAPGHHEDTLVNALLAHCEGSLSGIGGVARPGIVHRIDKDTSGLLVVAKHDKAHAHLARQLKNHTLKRVYQGIIWGIPQYPEGTIEGAIGRNPRDRKKMAVVKSGGKEATTHYKLIDTFRFTRNVPGKHGMQEQVNLAAHVQCELETGRTHQIRVHFAHHQFPMMGDQTYGQSMNDRLKTALGKSLPDELRETLQGFRRQALHACALTLVHPTTKEELTFEAPLPEDFQNLLLALESVK